MGLMDTNQEFQQLWVDLLSILPKADVPRRLLSLRPNFEAIADRVGRVGNAVGTLVV